MNNVKQTPEEVLGSTLLKGYFGSPYLIDMPAPMERAVEIVFPLEEEPQPSVAKAIASMRAHLDAIDASVQPTRAWVCTGQERFLAMIAPRYGEPGPTRPRVANSEAAADPTELTYADCELLGKISFLVGLEQNEPTTEELFEGILETLAAIPTAIRYLRLALAKAEYDHACKGVRGRKRLAEVQKRFAREFGTLLHLPEEHQPWDGDGIADLNEEFRQTGPTNHWIARAMLVERLITLMLSPDQWEETETALEMDLREYIYETALEAEQWIAALAGPCTLEPHV